MKTTIDIADPLFVQAKRVAEQRGTTLRALVEQGLRQVLADSAKVEKQPFRLAKASFKGRGLRPEMQGADWNRLRESAYEGRGG
jgi:hypothetical protein